MNIFFLCIICVFCYLLKSRAFAIRLFYIYKLACYLLLPLLLLQLLLLLLLLAGGPHLKTESAPGQSQPLPPSVPQSVALGNVALAMLAWHSVLASFVFTACILYPLPLLHILLLFFIQSLVLSVALVVVFIWPKCNASTR